MSTITLGIETSCDETALALIETRTEGGKFQCRVISSLVHSQAELHSAYGGVFPSLAKREHGRNIVPLLSKLFEEADVYGSDTDREKAKISDETFRKVLESFKKEIQYQNPDLYESFRSADFLRNMPGIDSIAVTEGPGLEPALWVGIKFAEMLSALWNKPLKAVNHMEGHVVGSLLPSDQVTGTWQELKPMAFPALALLISGGHTELVRINEKDPKYEIIGQTKDDAVGEAFDKVARLLGLPYPGGPHISKLAHEAVESGIVSEVKLPRPMLNSGDLNFSFSGLKTAVLYAVRDHRSSKDDSIDEIFKKGLAREFEKAVSETLDKKLRSAIESMGAKTLIIGGGVSANTLLQETFKKTASEYGLPIYLPSRHISGDNALMIALAGAMHAGGSNHNDGNSIGDEPRKLRAQGTMRLGL